MITVLHLLNTEKFSGAEHVVINIIRLNRGIRMIYASLDGPIREKLQENGIEFFPLEDSSAKAVKTAVEKYQPDIIHAHDFTMSCYAALVCGKIPVISQLHNNPPWIRKFYDPRSIAYAMAQIKIKRLIVVSDAIVKEYAYGFLIKRKTSVIGNIVDADEVLKRSKKNATGTEAADCESMNQDFQYDIAFLGRLSPQKNPLYFCRLIKQVKKFKPHVRAVMIGDGELMDQTKQYIETNGLSGNICMTGFLDNPYCLLNQSKVLLMPSVWEGFGLAAVEAMILGKPVVCSGAGGLSDIVDETCGWIAKNDREYVTEIQRLLDDAHYYNRKSEEAVKRSRESCDMESYKAQINRVYQNIMRTEGARRK